MKGWIFFVQMRGKDFLEKIFKQIWTHFFFSKVKLFQVLQYNYRNLTLVIILLFFKKLIPFLNELELFCFHSSIKIVSTGWNDKIVVQKKTTLQLYFKTFIEKINSANLIM